jgi:hypothetical protein
MPLAAHVSALALSLWIVGGVVVLLVAAGLAGRWFVKRGMRRPAVVRLANRIADRVVEAVKRPITIAVLDEVSAVLQTGNYTRNIAAALEENRRELKEMVAEKIREDPAAGRINLVPFADRLIEQASETTIRVILEILLDPRTDELVSDLLRDNITQIRAAVREDRPTLQPWEADDRLADPRSAADDRVGPMRLDAEGITAIRDDGSGPDGASGHGTSGRDRGAGRGRRASRTTGGGAGERPAPPF